MACTVIICFIIACCFFYFVRQSWLLFKLAKKINKAVETGNLFEWEDKADIVKQKVAYFEKINIEINGRRCTNIPASEFFF